MPLSSDERSILEAAGVTADTTLRRQAVAIVHAKSGGTKAEAGRLLAASYLATTQPSFHLIPRGDAMTPQSEFREGYRTLEEATDNFSIVSESSLTAALVSNPASLAPLRMILGFTHNEFAVAMKLVDPSARVSGNSIKGFERSPVGSKKRSAAVVHLMAKTVLAVMSGDILTVPPAAALNFHSKLEKRDTRAGWASVQDSAHNGVPYWAFLYQRYVGGTWRQVQDAYSEVKGDALLEVPLATLLTREGIRFFQSPTGASGAALTAQRYGLSPGPDFLLPDDSPTVVIESKIGEDGGTVRDKASRITNLAVAAHQRGLIACAVVDGKGWSERPTALLEVIVATEGRTYTLATLEQVLEIPEVASLRKPPA